MLPDEKMQNFGAKCEVVLVLKKEIQIHLIDPAENFLK